MIRSKSAALLFDNVFVGVHTSMLLLFLLLLFRVVLLWGRGQVVDVPGVEPTLFAIGIVVVAVVDDETTPVVGAAAVSF